MCISRILVKTLFLCTVIFMFFAGNMCFSEEITLTTVMPNPLFRIVRGTVVSGNVSGNFQNPMYGDGFTVVECIEPGGQYAITFDEPFSAPPTLVCTYQLMPTPGVDGAPPVPADPGVRAQVLGVYPGFADVGTVNETGHVFVSSGAFTFIAIGPR